MIFGCGGNRSGLRRNRMGETAGRLADITILTSDNPRWEDPERILDDIERGHTVIPRGAVMFVSQTAGQAVAIRCFNHARGKRYRRARRKRT